MKFNEELAIILRRISRSFVENNAILECTNCIPSLVLPFVYLSLLAAYEKEQSISHFQSNVYLDKFKPTSQHNVIKLKSSMLCEIVLEYDILRGRLYYNGNGADDRDAINVLG